MIYFAHYQNLSGSYMEDGQEQGGYRQNRWEALLRIKQGDNELNEGGDS